MNKKNDLIENGNSNYQNYYPEPSYQLPPPPLMHPYYWDWMYYSNYNQNYNITNNYEFQNHDAQNLSNNLKTEQQKQENKNENQLQQQYMPFDASYLYTYQMTQYYQQQQLQQAYYYQQFYEYHQQQQQQQLSAAQAHINEIEEDACKEDRNLVQIQKLIKNDQSLLINKPKAHLKAIFCMNKLIKIQPNNPKDGQTASIDILTINDLIDENDEKIRCLREFPGPLIKDKTSKTSITQYCQKKVRECLNNTLLIDSSSYALIWEYLSLLVRQNGIIDLKTDISSLLLGETQNWSLNDNHHQMIIKQNNSQTTTPALFNNIDNDDLRSNTPNSEINSITENIQSINLNKKQNIQNMSEDEILMKLRELLANGQRGDAFEWSIKNNLLSHAFFIAITQQQQQQKQQQQLIINDNKLIERVKTKFINSFITQDPLKTCYQLYNGNSPTITTIPNLLCEWNDWRRHLAMIVSNQESYNNEKVIKSIKSMGDCLATNNRIAASHFCYLLANVQFGDFKKKSSKIVLIGSSHNQEFTKFCQLISIQATEIYEYATNNVLNNFLQYKLIYASRLAEYGLFNEAYKYIEVIANSLNLNPKLHSDKLSSAYHLADRLRQNDIEIQMNSSIGSGGGNEIVEPQWFIKLRNNYKSFYFNESNDYNEIDEEEENQKFEYPERTPTPVSISNNDNQFKQPNEPKNNNKRKYNSQQHHYTDQIYNQLSQQQNDLNIYNTSSQDRTRKKSYDFTNSGSNTNTNENAPVPMYQLPIQSVSDYTLSQNNNHNNINNDEPFTFTTQTLPSSLPSLLENNNYNNNNENIQQNDMIDYSHQQQQQQQQQIPMYQLPNSNVDSFPMPFNNNNNNQQLQNQNITQFDEEDGNNVYNNNNNKINNYDNQYIGNNDLSSSNNNNNDKQKTNDNEEEDLISNKSIKKEPMDDKDKNKQKANVDVNQQGGLFSKLWPFNSKNGPNEKKQAPKKVSLPSDKKKTIIWDEEKKCYVNLAEPDQGENKIKPPPTSLPATSPSTQTTTTNNSSIIPSEINNQNNNFTSTQPQQQLQQTVNAYSLKNKGRANYYAKLDVMGNAAKKIDNNDIKPFLSNVPPPSQLPSNFFIPQPTSTNNESVQQQSQQEPISQPQQQMQFFNPSNFNNPQMMNFNQ